MNVENRAREMLAERTLVLIKPDGVNRGLIGRILQRFEDVGLKIVGLKMVRASRVCQAMQRHLGVWSYWSWSELDEIVSTRSFHPHVGWVRDGLGPDAELMHLGKEDLCARGISAMTLAERLLLGFKHFRETGILLDPKEMTWCGGSHDPIRGGVPIVGRSLARGYDVDIGICWDRPGGSPAPLDGLGVRAIVV